MSLPTFYLDWVDVNSNLCVYTHKQITKFPRVHLVAVGWYLDCSCEFVSEVEVELYNTFVSFAPEMIELEEEPETNISAPPPTENDVALVKGNSKGRKVVAHVSS